MPCVYQDLRCARGSPSSQVQSDIKNRTMFSLAEQVLQHEVTTSMQILRNTHVYVLSQHGPVEIMSQMLKPLALREHVIEQRLQ